MNLILHKRRIRIKKMQRNLALLTKAYIEYVNMGPLMNTLKKTVKNSNQKVFKNAKIVDSNSGINL